MGDRLPSNTAEAELWKELRDAGWEPTRRGWPDVIAYRGDQAVLIEVKPHKGRRLKREQLRVLRALARYGVPCYRWSPDGGLERMGAGLPDAEVAAGDEGEGGAGGEVNGGGSVPSAAAGAV